MPVRETNGDGVKSATVNDSFTRAFKVLEFFMSCTGKVKSTGIVTAHF